MYSPHLFVPLHPLTHFGEVLEWLKRHAWKACNRQNRFAGSNPVLSAEQVQSSEAKPRGFLFSPQNRFKAPRQTSGLFCSLRFLLCNLLPLGIIEVPIFLYHDASVAHDLFTRSGGRGVLECGDGDVGGGVV